MVRLLNRYVRRGGILHWVQEIASSRIRAGNAALDFWKWRSCSPLFCRRYRRYCRASTAVNYRRVMYILVYSSDSPLFYIRFCRFKFSFTWKMSSFQSFLFLLPKQIHSSLTSWWTHWRIPPLVPWFGIYKEDSSGFLSRPQCKVTCTHFFGHF